MFIAPHSIENKEQIYGYHALIPMTNSQIKFTQLGDWTKCLYVCSTREVLSGLKYAWRFQAKLTTLGIANQEKV